VTERGRLAGPDTAPERGELVTPLVAGTGFTVEQIISGRLESVAEYDQDHDEWVVVLAGAAVLEVDGVARDLQAGDWWLLPAGAPHRLLHTEPGTSWLAVRSTR
jgi:cupin 2 domain-containing protein